MADEKTESIITTRRNSVFKTRIDQILFNRACADGGRPYIDMRLWRAPNETDKQWNGDPEDGTVGRKTRTAFVNDAGRIVAKINQYIFKKPAERTGIDPKFEANVTGDGEGINQFMERVNTAITTGRWCWVKVDRNPAMLDEFGNPVPRNLQTKQEQKDFVRWELWESCHVPDWCIESDGTLRWIITEASCENSSDPLVKTQSGKVYTLYYLNPRDGRVHITEETDNPKLFGEGELRSDFVTDLDRIPFVLVNTVSARPWWFDDVENVCAQLLNLDSMHNESLTDSVYPQLVVPMSLLNTLETNLDISELRGERLITLQREVIKGRRNPFFESPEDRGTTRYISPSSQELKAITDEETRKRGILFDMCGLALFNRESRQAQTAESKSFDQLDTNATLGNRALILQQAETKLVVLSRYFDPSFAEYTPVYPSKFDVIDAVAMRDCIDLVGNMPNATTAMRKVALKAGLRLMLEMGGCDSNEFKEASEEIDALTDADFTPVNPFADMPDDDGDGDGDDDEDPKKGGKKTPPNEG